MTLNSYAWLNSREVEAAILSAKDAGEYIESIGKTDLAEYSQEEFETLLLVICNSMSKNSIPF